MSCSEISFGISFIFSERAISANKDIRFRLKEKKPMMLAHNRVFFPINSKMMLAIKIKSHIYSFSRIFEPLKCILILSKFSNSSLSVSIFSLLWFLQIPMVNIEFKTHRIFFIMGTAGNERRLSKKVLHFIICGNHKAGKIVSQYKSRITFNCYYFMK